MTKRATLRVCLKTVFMLFKILSELLYVPYILYYLIINIFIEFEELILEHEKLKEQ